MRSERVVTTWPSIHSSLAVYPVDEFSGGESLVSALLQGPFSPEVESERITKRWEGHDQSTRLDIECGGIMFTFLLVLSTLQIHCVPHEGYEK